MAPGLIAELFERHGAAVYRRCRAMLGDEAEARDAVQEVFLRAHAQQSTFRGQASAFTWIYSIATTYCLQQLRNAATRSRKLEQMGREAGGDRPDGPDTRLRTLALLQGFPPEVQHIVYLRHLDGLELAEIGELTGLSTKTISRRLQEFAERSRAALGDARMEGSP